MGHEKRTKVIAILALIVAVLGLSVGFSAYSKTLNIQNVQATVQGNENNFSVVFSTASDKASPGSVNGSINSGSGTVGSATLSGTTISNLTATFESASSGQIQYSFYVYNNGSIPAYITGITFGEKTCTGGPGTNSELVSSACSVISNPLVSVNGTFCSFTQKISNSKKIDPGTSIPIYVLLTDNTSYTSATVDGDFTVKYGDITLTFSSQKPSA